MPLDLRNIRKNVTVMWVKVIGPLRDLFYSYVMIKIIGKRNFFSSLDSAIKQIHGKEISRIEKKMSRQINHN